MRHSMIIELDRCVGCLACVSSCKEQWDTGNGAARCWVHAFEHGTRQEDLGLTFYPGLCMQCEEHPCTQDCPTGATYLDERGVVLVDASLCIGCGNCISRCAYGARHADPVKGIVEKCNLCKPLVDRGETPACVATCLAECRTFGDLDDPNSLIAKKIRESGARPLNSAIVDIGAKVHYAGDAHRAAIVAAEVIKPPEPSLLTEIWRKGSRPVARYVVPPITAAAFAGGAVINLVAARRRKVAAAEEAEREAARVAAGGAVHAPELPPVLQRHRTGMRVLHWFNLLTWALLLSTGTALMTAKSFALFGEGFPRWMAGLFGGAPSMLRFHALWGLLWTVATLPLFLIFKQGGLEALREIWITRDDLVWLFRKPFDLLGLSRHPLPPQDKYNAGQKLFAASAVLGTATIMASGLVMTFHWGSAATVAAAILVHKLAVMLALVGVSVHVTMAALVKEERPALRSMLTGRVERSHAEEHAAKWVQELAAEHKGQSGPEGSGRKER